MKFFVLIFCLLFPSLSYSQTIYLAGDSLMVGMQREISPLLESFGKTKFFAKSGTSTKTVRLPENLKEGDVILLSLGTNDIMGNLKEEDVIRIIEKTRKAELIWILPPHFLYGILEKRLQRTSETLIRILKEKEIQYIDLREIPEIISNKREKDGVHFTSRGYVLLSEYVVSRIR